MDRSLVRPRFTDGTFDAPLLLEEHFEETILSGSRRHIFIEGARGSGLTTALALLAQIARRHGFSPLFAGELVEQRRDALAKLALPRSVLFADLSVTPLGRDLELLRALGPRFLQEHALVVVGSRLGPLLRWSRIDPEAKVELAPWGKDELVELLGTDSYRESRPRLLAALSRLEKGKKLLARPRTARWIVEAALRLDEGEPCTLSRLYANVLDDLSPATIALAKRTARLDRTARELEGFDLEEVLAVYDVSSRAARALVRNQKPLRGASPPLLLEGLHDFLEAGAVVKEIACEDPSTRARPGGPGPSLRTGSVAPKLQREVLPFVAEMLTPALLEKLEGWLAATVKAPLGAESCAASILHACGRPLTRDLEKAELEDAFLAGADLKGANLEYATLSCADVASARFDEARLSAAILTGADASGASFDRADMGGATLKDAQLYGASFRAAKLNGAWLTNASAEGACFAGAVLVGARVGAGAFQRADFTDASLRGATIGGTELAEADFTGADMNAAQLLDLDLRESRFLPASLVSAHFKNCRLSELDLAGLVADAATFHCCELSGTRLKGAHLRGARFFVRAHDATFEDANLQNAVFSKCNFHAGSSRSGLLLGKPALEGNMTRFYQEGTTDDAWASPDSIVVASFRGADLRGASFFDTDLFRVDFRGALMSDGLRAEALRQGAILD
ncbi:MAG TPA: pentapeptide repeat-containing protein [Planctomycetota bacterium]|nr:pentapeptide repeat-containing protein [Planctomycetota bacterium]